MGQQDFGAKLAALRAQTGNRPPVNPSGGAPPPAPMPPGQDTSGRSKVADFTRGGVKGVGETGFGLGELVHSTPLLGELTDALAKMVGPEGTDPEAAFNGRPDILEPKSPAESLGKTAEQIGEYFLPVGDAGSVANMARKASIKGLVEHGIPNAASPETMKLLNKIYAVMGRSVGEGATAGALSSVHGNEDPEVPALVGAAGPLVGEAGSQAAGLLRTNLGKQLAPYLAGLTAMKAIPGITGIGAMMGGFGLTRMGMKRLMSHPAFVPTLQSAARTGAEMGARGLAAVTDVATPSRRRLPADVK